MLFAMLVIPQPGIRFEFRIRVRGSWHPEQQKNQRAGLRAWEEHPGTENREGDTGKNGLGRVVPGSGLRSERALWAADSMPGPPTPSSFLRRACKGGWGSGAGGGPI